jgi:hypothetical protein
MKSHNERIIGRIEEWGLVNKRTIEHFQLTEPARQLRHVAQERIAGSHAICGCEVATLKT